MTTSTILDERMNVMEWDSLESRHTTTPCGWESAVDENAQSPQKGRPPCNYTVLAHDKRSSPEFGAVNRQHSKEDKKCSDNAPECLVGCKPEQGEFGRQIHSAAQFENTVEPSRDVTLRHVRYEIGEHPLADIISLSGGGDHAARITVDMLVPGGKAAEAGVMAGDELVAVSGRPDFQRVPADRLLETLPTPTLLVFAKDAKAMPNIELNRNLERAMCLAEIEAKNLAEMISSDDAFASKPQALSAMTNHAPLENVALRLEATTGNSANKNLALVDVPDWFNMDAISRVASREVQSPVFGEVREGFAGTSWDIGDRREPTCGEENQGGLQNQLPGSQHRDSSLSMARSEPVAPKQTFVATKCSLPSKDDAMVGVPTSKAVFELGVQVELCDQVVFQPGATLLIEGQQCHVASTSKPLRDTENVKTLATAPSEEREDDIETIHLAWMYELRRVEARRLVESARRDALPRFDSSPETAHPSCNGMQANAFRTAEHIHSSSTTASSLGDQVWQERADTIPRGETLFEARGDTMATDFTRGDSIMSVDAADMFRSDTVVSIDTGNNVPFDWVPGPVHPVPKRFDKLQRSGPRLGAAPTGPRTVLQRVDPPDDWMASHEDEEALRFGQAIRSFTDA